MCVPHPIPHPYFRGTPRGLTEETCFREITGRAPSMLSTAPALPPLEEGDLLQSLDSRCSHTGRFPGPGADPGRLRGRQLLLERQIPSASSPPPPTGSSVAPQNEARLWGVGQAQRRKRRAPSFPTGGASS